MSTPTFQTETHSGRIQTRDRGVAGFWQFEFKYGAISRNDFGPLWAFLVQQKGRAEKFNVVNPVFHPIIGSDGGSPTVNGAHSKGATNVSTTGWNPLTTVLRAGDIIKFGGTKVYVVTSDATSGIGGVSGVNIYPPLVADEANGAAVTVWLVPFQMSFMSDFSTIDVDHCRLHRGLTVTMRERL
jgi:hypothetical protein